MGLLEVANRTIKELKEKLNNGESLTLEMEEKENEKDKEK